MADTIQLRRDTAANWVTANPVLADGEVGIETDTRKSKVGNGTTAWNSLPYSYGSSPDSTPTEDSTNLVTSGGVYEAIDVVTDLALAALDSIGDADDFPVKESSELARSGGVYDWVDTFDVSSYNVEDNANAQYATLALAIAAVPGTQRRGGMAIRFINSNTGEWEKWRYKIDSVTNANFTNVANWDLESLCEVFDISEYNSGATYADLAAALGTNGANVPEGIRKGGMSVKFIQSSDNKYVQYRLMATSWSTNVINWQGVDDKLMVGSKNFNDSDIIAKELNKLRSKIGESKLSYTLNKDNYCGLMWGGSSFVSANSNFNGLIIEVLDGQTVSWNKTSGTSVSIRAFDVYPQLNLVPDGVETITSSTYTANGKTKYILITVRVATGTYVEPVFVVTKSPCGLQASFNWGVVCNQIADNPFEITWDGNQLGTVTAKLYSGNTIISNDYTKTLSQDLTATANNLHIVAVAYNKLTNELYVGTLLNDTNYIVLAIIQTTTGTANRVVCPSSLYKFNNTIFEPFSKEYVQSEKNLLYGKKIVCFGDSITEMKDPDNKHWTDYFAELSGATVYNVGIGGAQMNVRGVVLYFNVSGTASNDGNIIITLGQRTATASVLTTDTIAEIRTKIITALSGLSQIGSVSELADTRIKVCLPAFFSNNMYVLPENVIITNSTGVSVTVENNHGMPNEFTSDTRYSYCNLDIPNMVYGLTSGDCTNQMLAAQYLATQGDDNTAQVATLSNLNIQDIDAVVIFGGTNNYNADNYGTPGTDRNLVSGQITNIINNLLSAKPTIKIYFLTPICRYFGSSISSWDDAEWGDNKIVGEHNGVMKELVAAITDAVKFWHIPVFDMYWSLGWNKFNYSNFFENNDGTHPKKLGGAETLATKIYRYLR